MTSGTSLSIAGLFPGYGAIAPKMCPADRPIERPKRFRCRVGHCLPFWIRLDLRVFVKLAGNRAAQEGCHVQDLMPPAIIHFRHVLNLVRISLPSYC